MNKCIAYITGLALLSTMTTSVVFAQQSLISPEEQEACRVEVNTLISQKERDLENRLNGFLTSYKLSPLDMIVRSKQSLSVFENDLDALCTSYSIKQAGNGPVGQACDNRILPTCINDANISKEKMKIATKEALFISSGRQRLFYLAQDINLVTKAINAQNRSLVMVDELLRTVAQKINYFTDKIVR